MRTLRRASIWLAAASILLATPSSANVMWPAMIMEQRLSAPWVILLGLAVEFAMLRYAFGIPPKRALIADLAANAASAALGYFGRPLFGMVWSVLPSLAGMGTFSLVDWVGTFVMSVLVNLLIEGLVYRYGFKLPWSWHMVRWIALANAVTVAIAYASTEIIPLQWH